MKICHSAEPFSTGKCEFWKFMKRFQRFNPIKVSGKVVSKENHLNSENQNTLLLSFSFFLSLFSFSLSFFLFLFLSFFLSSLIFFTKSEEIETWSCFLRWFEQLLEEDFSIRFFSVHKKRVEMVKSGLRSSLSFPRDYIRIKEEGEEEKWFKVRLSWFPFQKNVVFKTRKKDILFHFKVQLNEKNRKKIYSLDNQSNFKLSCCYFSKNQIWHFSKVSMFVHRLILFPIIHTLTPFYHLLRRKLKGSVCGSKNFLTSSGSATFSWRLCFRDSYATEHHYISFP